MTLLLISSHVESLSLSLSLSLSCLLFPLALLPLSFPCIWNLQFQFNFKISQHKKSNIFVQAVSYHHLVVSWAEHSPVKADGLSSQYMVKNLRNIHIPSISLAPAQHTRQVVACPQWQDAHFGRILHEYKYTITTTSTLTCADQIRSTNMLEDHIPCLVLFHLKNECYSATDFAVNWDVLFQSLIFLMCVFHSL